MGVGNGRKREEGKCYGFHQPARYQGLSCRLRVWLFAHTLVGLGSDISMTVKGCIDKQAGRILSERNFQNNELVKAMRAKRTL